MQVISNQKLSKNLKLRYAMDLSGVDIYKNNVTIDENGDIDFKNNKALEFVYGAMADSLFYKVMYMYNCGEFCSIMLTSPDEQYEILSTCNEMLDNLYNIRARLNEADRNIIQYAKYYTLYIKAWTVAHIEDLSCEVCRATGAKEYTLERIIEEIKDSLNNSSNQALYRIVAHILMNFDEAEKASQIMSLVCNWLGQDKDTVDLVFMQSTFLEYRNNIALENLRDIHNCESYILQAYAYMDVEDVDKAMDYLDKALEYLEKNNLYSFTDITHKLMIMKEQQVYIDSYHEEQSDMFTEKITCFIDVLKDKMHSKYIKAAECLGVDSDDLICMINLYIDELYD